MVKATKGKPGVFKKVETEDPVEAVLHRLTRKDGIMTDLHQEGYHELSGLVRHTVTTGSSNSVLVLGPNNVGKTTLVSRVVEEVMDTALVVKLSGLLQTDDKLALREIALQLKLDNVVSGTERVFGSFAQHLSFLLESLKSGGARTSAPIVFILDHFELFCLHHNQTLLYNLFDIAQTQAAPICVIGVSSHFDVVESLEKRVKSRFNHRQLVLLPHSTFDDYYKMVQRMLAAELYPEWHKSVVKTLESIHTNKLFKTLYGSNNTCGYLKQFLVTALSLLDPFQPLTFDHLSEVYTSQAEPLSEKGLLQGISVLEMCVLVAVKHVLAVYPDQPAFNFEMAFHEYDKFATRKAKLFRYDRSVVMKAWEALQDLELITPVDKGAVTKAQKEFRHFTLQVLPEQILSVVDASAPLTVKEWATSVTFQD